MALKLMAVDDDPVTLKLLKALLVSMKFEVLTIADSREAANLVNRERYDGFFVDANMPHMDGFELAQHIRNSAYNSRVPIAMLTAHDDTAAMRAAFKAGISLFLGKPPSRKKLQDLMKIMQGFMPRKEKNHVEQPLKTTVSRTVEVPRKTILIADDDKVTVHLLSARLKAKGFNVIVAFDTMQAWMSALSSSPTAILLDIGMPGGTGIDVLEKLKRSPKTYMIPVIVVSGNPDSEIAKTVKEIGAEEFFSKPIDLEKLHRTLLEVLGMPLEGS